MINLSQNVFCNFFTHFPIELCWGIFKQSFDFLDFQLIRNCDANSSANQKPYSLDEDFNDVQYSLIQWVFI